MPRSETTHLRIYCVCGQKMKVSEDMFGRPGKCVACRQKIRIPRPEEIPPNTTRLYLKDHPEFLRKVKHRPIDEEEAAPVPEAEKGKRRPSTAPFEVLEPLRLLCNLQDRVERQLRALDEIPVSKGKKSEDANRAELLGHRARIRSARTELEEELRQRLMETAIELASVQEKIAEVSLAARVGEVAYSEYREQVDRLRRIRDMHERRQVSLRGWLTVEDPHLAGGHQEVSFDQIPATAPRVVLPSEPEGGVPLLNWHVEELRSALDERTRAERKLGEVERMSAGAAMSGRSLEECRAEAGAERTRARSHVQFCRERLEQLAEDYASDMHALDAQLDHARGRLKAGQIGREDFNKLEREAVRARADVAKARSVVVRALSANSADEVPRARGTFVARLAKGTVQTRTTPDSWVAYVATGLIFLALCLPVAGTLSPLNAYRILWPQAPDAHWLFSMPIATAILLFVASFVPQRSVRGLLFAGIWLVGGLLSALYLHESAYTAGVVAERLREGGAMFTRTGVVVYMLAYGAMGVAAAMALIPLRETRAAFPAVAVVMALGLAAILTDFAGYRTAVPTIAVETKESATGPQDTTITIGNNGGRMLVLAADSTMKNAYDYLLETKIGGTSWAEAGRPESVRASGREVTLAAGTPVLIPVAAGSRAEFLYHLRPGTYRVLLRAQDESRSQDHVFSVEGTVDSRAVLQPSPEETVPDDATQAPPVSDELLRQIAPQVVLSGILTAPGKPANFSIKLVMPDGRSQANTYRVGDEIYGGWSVSEFNPREQTVTLARGENLLIIRRGAPAVLAPANL